MVVVHRTPIHGLKCLKDFLKPFYSIRRSVLVNLSIEVSMVLSDYGSSLLS